MTTTVHVYTKQECFDIVAVNLTRQYYKCDNPEISRCLFRFNSRKCAFGWLIKDDDYHPDMENFTSVSSILLKYPLAYIDQKFINFYEELQSAHDKLLPRFDNPEASIRAWVAEMRAIARENALTTTALEKALFEAGIEV